VDHLICRGPAPYTKHHRPDALVTSQPARAHDKQRHVPFQTRGTRGPFCAKTFGAWVHVPIHISPVSFLSFSSSIEGAVRHPIIILHLATSIAFHCLISISLFVQSTLRRTEFILKFTNFNEVSSSLRTMDRRDSIACHKPFDIISLTNVHI
jgi:hypothetical protein